jgi:hypothetical protein
VEANSAHLFSQLSGQDYQSATGQANLYVYVGNDPVNAWDPSGLEGSTPLPIIPPAHPYSHTHNDLQCRNIRQQAQKDIQDALFKARAQIDEAFNKGDYEKESKAYQDWLLLRHLLIQWTPLEALPGASEMDLQVYASSGAATKA